MKTIDTYFELVKEFPLRSISTDRQHAAAVAVVSKLLHAKRDKGAEEYLHALGDLIETYERANYDFDRDTPASVLSGLLDARGVTAAQLCRDTKLSKSTVSQILSGKRGFSKEMICSLARYFKESPNTFLTARL